MAKESMERFGVQPKDSFRILGADGRPTYENRSSEAAAKASGELAEAELSGGGVQKTKPRQGGEKKTVEPERKSVSERVQE